MARIIESVATTEKTLCAPVEHGGTLEFLEQYARARARVMGPYSGGIVSSVGAELQLSAPRAPPPYEGQLSARHGICIAFFQVQPPCGTADLAACERHISATTFVEVPPRAPR
jgi:hypothetical protein